MAKTEKKRLIISLPADILQRLENVSLRAGVSKSAIINLLLAREMGEIKFTGIEGMFEEEKNRENA